LEIRSEARLSVGSPSSVQEKDPCTRTSALSVI
jgi:hypothetical protein